MTPLERKLKLCEIKEKKNMGFELTERQTRIVALEETYKLKMSFFKIHQLGDPAELDDIYRRFIALLDEEITQR